MKSNPFLTLLFLVGITSGLMPSCTSEQEPEIDQTESFCAPQTLRGKQFSSEFHHYVNYYSFQTDSTGFSENGQLVWSIGLDPEKYADAMDSVYYEYPAPFHYTIVDSVLTIAYTDPDHPKTDQFRIFHFNCEEKQWIGTHEYAYGREYLREVSSKVKERHWN